MIEKMTESIFESMLPLTVEQFGSSPLINYPLTLSDEIKVESDPLLSDDHWKKFELDFPELSDIDDIFKELDNGGSFNSWQWNNEEPKDNVFLNHDCMWAGHCGSKEHSEESKLLSCMVPPQPPIIKQEMCPPPPVVTKAFAGQQSLLKPSVKAMNSTFVPASTATNNMLQHTPQTPPESDDEENKASNSLLKILNDAINECDLDEDNDLTEYFEGKEVEVKEEPIEVKEEIVLVEKVEEDAQEDTESDEQEEQEEMDYEAYRLRTQMAAENDHSYYKDKNAAMMRHNNYGLDTPSDSEDDEEIDVVSVSEKFTNATRIALSMPTNPSSRDKHQLQRRVATAMSRKRINNGIKTILPVSRQHPEPQPSKPNPSRRGVKRGRNNRNNGGYKRRRANNNKDIEEREPTDKRHLHNDMERQRRVDLRIAFDNLKAVVPEVSGTKKIAKVNILLQAAQYCYYLTGANSNYTRQLDDLRKKQVQLRAKVSQLRRNLAANR